MKKRTRSVLSLIMAAAMCFTLLGNAYASSELDRNQSLSELKAVEHSIEARLEQETSRAASIGYDSYNLGDVFVCTLKESAEDYEYAYNTGDEIHYKKYVDGELVEQEVVANDAVTVTATDEQLAILDDIIMDSSITGAERKDALAEIGYEEITYDGATCYVMAQPASTNATVYGGIDELLKAFPTQSGVLSYSKPFYCSYLSTNKTVYVRDTRNNYTSQSSITKNLLAGASVVVAAASVWANPSSLLAWLGLASSVTTLPSAATVCRTTEAKAYRYRYGEIYDTTTYNSYVTCASEWGYDYFTVSNQGSGYAWGLKASPTPLAQLYPVETIANNAANSYNTKLGTYGCWKN